MTPIYVIFDTSLVGRHTCSTILNEVEDDDDVAIETTIHTVSPANMLTDEIMSENLIDHSGDIFASTNVHLERCSGTEDDRIASHNSIHDNNNNDTLSIDSYIPFYHDQKPARHSPAEFV